ncbi:peroxidase family protein [Roseisalinus antarcticus]|uniref:Animal heme peroxidase n=1 Tax=Roseisalinus antarcticus TaxID=254357 RepID=A0A1Y5SZ06_9RHOB|nr:peroxidase family protein [Roseisalinus antarcticus]SLN52210.1 Animal heme peroxidase [Roseisalinus antarcticus]
MTEMTKPQAGMPDLTAPKLAGAGCLAPRRPRGAAESGGGRYSRLFPGLPPLGPAPAVLIALGREGGVCDGGIAVREATPAAGWPFFGQFIAHDITADRSPLERTEHGAVSNARAPRLNLECLYGGGPAGSPYLFDRDDPAKFLLAPGGKDVPRARQGIAIIGDPRNDSHLIMAAMHLALLKAHNAFVDIARNRGVDEGTLFDAARQALTWHYQWVVTQEFLPSLIGADLVAGILSGRDALPLPEGATLPLEFADAAYRYGHSQIRQSYILSPGGPTLSLFPDLLGFRPVPKDRSVDWRVMFDGAPDVGTQRATRISERLPMALIALPEEVTGAVQEQGYRSLANRDMQRGVVTDLPSGEAVARALGVAPLPRDAIGLQDWSGETPLWFYIAREADTLGEGDHLGPVGGRIVGGVLLSLLQRDPASYLTLEPDWRPEITPLDPTRPFALLDLLMLGADSPNH